MAYGFRTFDTDGNVLVDFSTQLTRLLYQRYVGANESGSIEVPGFSGNGGHAWGYAVRTAIDWTEELYAATYVGAHEVTWVGDTISWAPNYRYPSPSYIYVLMWGPA